MVITAPGRSSVSSVSTSACNMLTLKRLLGCAIHSQTTSAGASTRISRSHVPIATPPGPLTLDDAVILRLFGHPRCREREKVRVCGTIRRDGYSFVHEVHPLSPTPDPSMPRGRHAVAER